VSLAHRFWALVRRHPKTGCPHCGLLLVRCPACRGDWRSARCWRCSLGLLCPTHDRFWPA
jgi:predicted RNA-binding Zn-ribbon protein involved in translation (DUF1610 family)